MTSEQNKLSDVDLAARLTSLNPWADMDWPEVCKAAAAALSRRASAGGEATIWQAKDKNGFWINCTNEETARYIAEPHGGSTRPLYAASSPSSAPVVGDVAALREAYIRVTGATMWPTDRQFREILSALHSKALPDVSEALEQLLKAARTVQAKGAVTGFQWTALAAAIGKASAALNAAQGGK